MDVRKIYDALIERFGKSGIDSILYPCWDRDLVLYDMAGNSVYPYLGFVDNMKWFLNVLKERGVKL